MLVICVGNPFDGIRLYGPFRFYDDAIEYAKSHFVQGDWRLEEIHSVHDAEYEKMLARGEFSIPPKTTTEGESS